MDKVKVLYVEDEPFLAKIVKESLESRDYDVRLITQGNQALSAFQELQPDICILDIMLPHQDGYSIATEIRELDPSVPILFVTAKNQTEDVLKGFSVGGNDYIRKPFSLEELIARLVNLLQMTHQHAQDAPAADQEISIGRYVFRPNTLELIYQGNEARQLSYREAQILELLCTHLNATLERKKLLLHVWGDDSFFNSRNLDVYMRKIRSYFSYDERINIITLKGVGYLFSIAED